MMISGGVSALNRIISPVGRMIVLACLLLVGSLLLAGCDDSGEEELDEDDLKAVLTFNEWLYRSGTPPLLKYYIERETKNAVQLESAMTLYSQGELVGLSVFSVALNSPINIDYFAIRPDKNLPVDEIELKDVYVNDVKYSLSKIFRVIPEPVGADGMPIGAGDPLSNPDATGPPSTVQNPNCNGTPGTRYNASWSRSGSGTTEHALFVEDATSRLTVCIVSLGSG